MFKPLLRFALAFVCFCHVALAQELPKVPGPEKEHALLKLFVGQWETSSEGLAEPGKPPMKCTGNMKAKMLGEFWLLTESEINMDKTKIVALQTIGYDPKKKKYIGTWVDSMMNYMWKYEGSVDSTGKILTLDAEGPNFMEDGKMAKFQDVYEFKSAHHIVVSSRMQDKDGKWITFMTANAKRKKAIK